MPGWVRKSTSCGVLLLLAAQAAGAETEACRPRYFVDRVSSQELIGVYELSNGELLRFGREVNRFYAEMPGTGRVEVVPVDQDEFVEKGGSVRLTFDRVAFATDVTVRGLDGQPSGPPVCR
jgi:hypothetical protein